MFQSARSSKLETWQRSPHVVAFRLFLVVCLCVGFWTPTLPVSAQPSAALVQPTANSQPTSAAPVTAFVERQKLVATDGTPGNDFGTSVAVNAAGNIAVIGAARQNNFTGAAYVFVKDAAGNWSQQQKLLPDGGQSNDKTGKSVAINAAGDVILVSRPGNLNSRGRILFYTKTGTGANPWILQQAFANSNGLIGTSIAINDAGDRAVVLVERDFFNDPGIYFYAKTGTGATSWTLEQSIRSVGGLDAQVTTNATGDVAFLTANGRFIYAFTRTGTGATPWARQTDIIIPPTTAPVFSPLYSLAVNKSGQYLAVGSPGENSGSGMVFVFAKTGSTWTVQQTITTSDIVSGTNAQFGSAVAFSLDGNRLISGASNKNQGTGAAYIFAKTGTGTTAWTEQQVITGSDLRPTDYPEYGNAVAFDASGKTALVGAWYDRNLRGAVYVYNDTYVPPTVTTTTLQSDIIQTQYGQPVTFIATVTPQNAPGTVTFKSGVTTLGTANVVNGKATLTTTSLEVGTYQITAEYTPTGNFLPSTSAPFGHEVVKAITIMNIDVTVNPALTTQPVTITAYVASSWLGGAVPTGTVRLNYGANVVTTTVNVNGFATFPNILFLDGIQQYSASYLGNSQYLNQTAADDYEGVTNICAGLVVTSTVGDENTCGSLLYAVKQATTRPNPNTGLPISIGIAPGQAITLSQAISLPLLQNQNGIPIVLNGGCEVDPLTGRGKPLTRLTRESEALAGSAGLTVGEKANVRGLAIGGFDGYGIVLTGTSEFSRLYCNWIGTLDGQTGIPNGGGILSEATGNSALLGDFTMPPRGNLIAGNNGIGIRLKPGSSSLNLYHTWVGLGANGTTRLPNTSYALLVEGGGRIEVVNNSRIVK